MPGLLLAVPDHPEVAEQEHERRRRSTSGRGRARGRSRSVRRCRRGRRRPGSTSRRRPGVWPGAAVEVRVVAERDHECRDPRRPPLPRIARRIPLTTPRAIPSISAAAKRRQKPDRSLVSALCVVLDHPRLILTAARTKPVSLRVPRSSSPNRGWRWAARFSDNVRTNRSRGACGSRRIPGRVSTCAVSNRISSRLSRRTRSGDRVRRHRVCRPDGMIGDRDRHRLRLQDAARPAGGRRRRGARGRAAAPRHHRCARRPRRSTARPRRGGNKITTGPGHRVDHAPAASRRSRAATR